ncbi:MAG: hypothetical protein AAFN77_02825 [Planctomycetota bacterium]
MNDLPSGLSYPQAFDEIARGNARNDLAFERFLELALDRIYWSDQAENVDEQAVRQTAQLMLTLGFFDPA